MAGKLIFVTGGIRSGKSAFAEEVTSRLGEQVTYIATAQALDEEMKHRIRLHRERRPGNWTTVEEPLQVTGVITEYGGKCDVIMLDCMTILLSNMMFEQEQKHGEFRREFQDEMIEEICSLARAAKETSAHVVIVSNEVGMTLVSDNFLGRQYQELVGRANQVVAGLADEAYLVVAGHPIDLKSGRSYSFMKTSCIMLQGTGSHVGKSVLVAALCRIFLQDGYKVAPFKSQNMALNSYVTKDGGEMGRAQVVQAEAAGLAPDVVMNPVLLKPTGQATSQVIVMGRPVGNLSAKEYHEKYNMTALGVVEEALNKLRSEFNVVVIEGAGSPAEVNLQATEIVNMRIARMADCPVLLVADIDKGGALASVVGTLELLDPADRARVAGVIINKFRGDVRLFQPAVDFLEGKTGIPVVGIVPYFQGFRVQEEDTIPDATLMSAREVMEDKIDVAVINLPHISNFTDFDPLEDEPDVQLRYVGKGSKLGNPDMIIIPGSKNTINDLAYLEKSGLADRIREHEKRGIPVVGICGGFQILGRELHDPLHTESDIDSMKGLGLLNVVTTFDPDKITTQVQAEVIGTGPLLNGCKGQPVTGYEIHMGRSELGEGVEPAFRIFERSTKEVDILDGAVRSDGRVFGTYIHGIFDNDRFRRHIINLIREHKGWGPLVESDIMTVHEQREKDFNKLADVVRNSLDMDKIYRIMSLDAADKQSGLGAS